MRKYGLTSPISSLFIIIYLLVLFSVPLSLNMGYSKINKINYNNSHPFSQQTISKNNYNATGAYNINILANYSQQKYNMTNIEIELPSNNCSITQLELEFDKISIGQEKIIIEDNSDDFEVLEAGNVERLAMQLKISELTIIYSVEIFGFKLEVNPDPAPIYFKITEWDSTEHEPIMNSVHGTPIELNMSNTGWNIQIFPEPIILIPGDYALVMDGYHQIKYGDQYFWFINETKTGSELYMAYYERRFSAWRWTERYEDVFLHRINRWVNKTLNPSEVNMSVVIEDIPYLVSDGAQSGTGSLVLENLNLVSIENNLCFPILINQTLQLKFDINSSLRLSEIAIAFTNVQIGGNTTNYWNIFPEIERYTSDLMVKIAIPQNWYNVEIYNNDVNITADPNIIFSNNTLYILNDTIENGAEWRISAMNIPKTFSLNLTDTIYNPAEDLIITVQSNFLQGKYLLQIRNPEDSIIYEEEMNVDSEFEVFNYLIRNDAIEGSWAAIVYWYNVTDAGLQIINFYIDIPVIIPPLDPLIIILTVLIGSLIIGISYSSYKMVQVYKRKEAVRNKLLADKARDLTNLQYLMIVDKKSSLDLFTQSFSEKKLDLTLISGFLDAIRSFGIELTESSEQSQIIKLEYQESKIIMSEYKGFRLIFIMKDVPSYEFLDSLKDLLIRIDEKFSRFLDNFDGDLRPFKYVERLIIATLGTSFIYPLKFIDRENIKLNSVEKEFIIRARTYMKTTNKDYFFIKRLLSLEKLNPSLIRVINSLIKKRIFEPIIGYGN